MLTTRPYIYLCIVMLLAACGANPTPALPTIAVREVSPPPSQTAPPAPTEAVDTSSLPTLTPSITPTASITPSETVTVTPSATITDTPSPIPSSTPTQTLTPVPLEGIDVLGELAARATVLPANFTYGGTPVNRVTIVPPPNYTPSAYTLRPLFPSVGGNTAPNAPQNPFNSGAPNALSCPYVAPNGFGVVTANNPNVLTALGCPVGAPPLVSTLNSAYQPFQNGFMLWVENPSGAAGNIYTVFNNGTYQVFLDTWNPATDPESGNETPPDATLQAPIRGFGKVWRENPALQGLLGWGIGGEQGTQVALLNHERGVLLSVPPRGEVIALAVGGAWQGYSGSN